MGLSYKEIKENLGLKSRSTAQTACQRFLRTNRPATKAQRKRAKTNSSKSGKDAKTTLERVRVLQNSFSTSKIVSKCTTRRILKKYGIVSRKAAKKFNLNKKQRLIRKRWCPLVVIQRQFSTENGKKFWNFLKEERFKKTLKVPKKPKRNKKSLSNQSPS